MATARSSAAVAVEVPRHDGVRVRPHRVRVPAGWNVPSPLPSSTETSFEASVDDGEVGPAVAVEVPRHDGVGVCTHRVLTAGWNVPSPLPSRMETSLENVVGDGEVERGRRR